MGPSILPLSTLYPPTESPSAQTLISILNLTPHAEGGYFVETDRDPLLIPNPFLPAPHQFQAPRSTETTQTAARNASTTIFYFLTQHSPFGGFHRNKGRTVHTLHKGRGTYVVIHADEVGTEGGNATVETFAVGWDVEKGERLQWVVEGGKYKASFLEEGQGELLISETVVPGFEYVDHNFMLKETLRELVTPLQAEELEWLVRRDGVGK